MLEGLKIVEFATYVAGPSAATVMSDWGAEVIKIEPPNGDPFRGLFAGFGGAPAGFNPPFELDNRGKRSIALNLGEADGRMVAQQLIDKADVFVSNMRPRVLEKYGLAYDACAARNPRLVYAQMSAYGPETDDANRASYDIGAFWSRAGVAASLVPPGGDPPQQRGGMGDHMTGTSAAGAVSAALYRREITGKGQRIGVSLLRVGIYMMGWDMNIHLRSGMPIVPVDRFHAANPIINCFRAEDGKWFFLLLLQADRHWPDLIRAIDRPGLLDDDRFKNIGARRENSEALVQELDAVFSTKTLAQWREIFDRENVWFAPVQTLEETASDPVAQQAGAFIEIQTPDGPRRQVATPADFYGTPIGPRTWAPEAGQDTEQILLELGYDWEKIIALKEEGAIP